MPVGSFRVAHSYNRDGHTLRYGAEPEPEPLPGEVQHHAPLYVLVEDGRTFANINVGEPEEQ